MTVPAGKTAFVFAGGGSLGAIQVGMLRALLSSGLHPDFVVGASVGALNAGYFASAPNAGHVRIESNQVGIPGGIRLWDADVAQLLFGDGVASTLPSHAKGRASEIGGFCRKLCVVEAEDDRWRHIRPTPALGGQVLGKRAPDVPVSGTLVRARPRLKKKAKPITDSVKIKLPPHDPIASTLSAADDRIVLSHWLPPQQGSVPRIRIGRRWISILWAIPIGAAALVLLIALAQSLREFPSVRAFIRDYPGIAQAAPSVDSGFPWWLQLQHFLNMLFMMFIIRSGIQILADHPRLYWSRDCTPGTEWFRFQHPIPEGRIWTSKDDSVTLPGWLGIPGIRHSIGLARWWHFSILLLWTINGIAFFVLLFATDQWRRLVPLTWEVFPNALSTAIQYASLNFPVDHSWTRYNGLQQLSYFITVFIAAPVSIATGLMQSPAISNRLGLLGTVLNRQAARSIHFISFSWFVLFILAHGIMVFVTGLRQNTNHMFFGVKNNTWSGLPLFVLAMAVVGLAWWAASPFTIRHARLVQRTGRLMVGWIKGLSEWWEPTAQLAEKDISPHFWSNGTMPNSAEFDALVAERFEHYRLRVGGLVEAPREFSFSDLKALPKQEQITTHFCIQGWSGVAKWGGVPMRDILDIVKPAPDARYAVFYSFSEGSAGGGYYDVHEIHNMRHRLTILAYEMNGAPISVLHGAPLRLRCENELGFKMVKWIAAIEFVHDFAHLGAGQGGYNEDHEFYGYRMPI